MLHQKKVGRTVTHRSRKLTIRDGVKLLRAKPWSHWTVNVFWLFLQTFCPCSFRLWMGFGSERSGKNNSPLRWEKKKIMCMCFYKWNGLFLSLGAISSQRERWVGHHRKFSSANRNVTVLNNMELHSSLFSWVFLWNYWVFEAWDVTNLWCRLYLWFY